jgi:hypothetical protein
MPGKPLCVTCRFARAHGLLNGLMQWSYTCFQYGRGWKMVCEQYEREPGSDDDK